MRKLILFFSLCVFNLVGVSAYGQTKKQFAVIAYYAGKNPLQLDSFATDKLTHIIFSFCHLKGARLNVDSSRDTVMIQKNGEPEKNKS